ncbi:MAG TPA: DUF523 and DUF1722 domain-containing protein [Nitrospira sp.]|nr:DUF523 and DUF1722 domain-containing protein [Nitrospira sp.]
MMPRKLPIRVGVSRCLLGDEVRYDGGHKRDRFLTDVLGRHVEWVPVCPEVEAGLGTPREAMRLVGDSTRPQLVTITSGRNMTEPLIVFAKRKLEALEQTKVSGYIFKKDSPSCGIRRVKLLNSHGMPNRTGVGLFARAFTERFPLVPIEDEGRLRDPALCDNFIERIFCYHRWQQLVQDSLTRREVVVFHTVHKYLLLAHSRERYQSLGRLVGQAHRYSQKELIRRYGVLFMQALTVRATRRKHVNVLQHLVGQLKKVLTPKERMELEGVISDYYQSLVPLIVPITLVKHYVTMYKIDCLQHQIYLNPHPKELMLRNDV